MEIRTHTCGELISTNIGDKVTLNGWVNSVRFHGQVIFVDIRDRYGKTQIVFNQDSFKGDFELIKKISSKSNNSSLYFKKKSFIFPLIS